MDEFTAEILPTRVRFGTGMDPAIAEEADRLGLSRVVVLSTPHQAEDARALADSLGARAVGIFDGAAMHTPVEATTRAMEHIAGMAADGIIALGGGSTIGLGKALALRTDLKLIAVPTTYAGSEATPILGQTENQQKQTLRSDRVLPKIIVYDVARTMSLPPHVTITSGLNAIAHAVEALYARDRNPVSTTLATQGLTAMIPALEILAREPLDPGARSDALYGAWMCGTVLGQVGMAMHHKLCHTIGGMFDLDHAATHSIILPHATGYNATAAERELAPLTALLGKSPGPGLFDLNQRLGAPTALKDIGMPESGIARAAEAAMQNAYWNPRPLERDAIEHLIAAAWDGRNPD